MPRRFWPPQEPACCSGTAAERSQALETALAASGQAGQLLDRLALYEPPFEVRTDWLREFEELLAAGRYVEAQVSAMTGIGASLWWRGWTGSVCKRCSPLTTGESARKSCFGFCALWRRNSAR